MITQPGIMHVVDLHCGGFCPTCGAQLNADGSSVDTLLEMRKGLWAMAADLEDALRHIAELQQRMDALAGTPRAFDPSAPRIEDTLQSLAAEVPPEEWERVPSDLSDQHDHYIYGTPREDDGTPAEDLQPSRFLSVIPEEFCEVIYHPDEEDDCSDGEDGGYDGD